MQLRPFLRQDEIKHIQVNQKDLYLDANALEDADIFEENLPVTQDDTSDEQPEEEVTESDQQNESPPFPDVYEPEIFTRRTSIRRDTPLGRQKQSLIRTQHPPMEIDEEFLLGLEYPAF